MKFRSRPAEEWQTGLFAKPLADSIYLFYLCHKFFGLETPEFLKYFEGHPQYADVATSLTAPPGEKIHLKGLIGSSGTVLLAHLFKRASRSFLVLSRDREEAAYLLDDLNNLGLREETLFFPATYKRPAEFGQPVQEQIVLRAEVLHTLLSGNQKQVMVTYPEALAEKVIPRSTLALHTLSISKGDKLSIGFLNEFLFAYGFERVDFVYEPGQFAIRGSIVDVFSFSNEDPYRIDFFGDEVDSIRSFFIDNQVSRSTLDTITLIPDIQQKADETEKISFYQFLSSDTLVFASDLRLITDQINNLYNQALQADENQPTAFHEKVVSGDDLLSQLEKFSLYEMGSSPVFQSRKKVEFHISKQPVFNKNFDLLGENLIRSKEEGYSVFLLSNQEKQIERLEDIFTDTGINARFTPVSFVLHEGFIDHDIQVCCYTDHQIFERYHRYTLRSRKPQREAVSFKELNKLHPGDYVVHVDHGIGRFAGLVKTERNGRLQEAVRVVYKNNDSLLVSIHALHRISKYKAKEGTEPTLHRLGSGAWQRLKNRTKSKVKDIARELIALYARRNTEKGFAFSPDSYLQNELEASFMYEDTPDQQKATLAVKEDMEKKIPMDRLVCGDVGFGKTEVAIRAAFKAVADNKQVALLVPTTILALQHFKTFTERLNAFPATIDYVSRLKSSTAIKQTLREVEKGKMDITIGTHRLVSKDVKFKDLGLLIIDEEQKFGVAVKEKLKQLKINVDTLTLTATPIPRTLQFSLMGARDLSIIQTPPPNRYPIVTEVHGFNEQIIRDAILYETERDGQVFFIHNRIENIHEVETLLNKIVPGIRTRVAHGRMEGPKLEKVMLDFINGKFEVLVATTIIESGLDIPNANTMIVNHAQNFGLSDLHQLRGRVGRSNKKAFCYLLAPPLSTLSPEAARRLKAIEEFSDLGSGFHIAMQDLDIRGAGNLLGAEQSGFIADIGFETYHRILQEAISELKQEEFKQLFEKTADPAAHTFLTVTWIKDCQIDTDLELLFPEEYIPGVSERMWLYRELDNVANDKELDEFMHTLTDRFGKIPPQSAELINVVRLRWQAIKLGIEKITIKKQQMIGYFVSDPDSPFYQSPEFQQLIRALQNNKIQGRMKESGNKLSLIFKNIPDISSARDVLNKVEDAIFPDKK